MDAFESIVAEILERQGFWVKQSVKVELNDKGTKIGRPTSRRWELDVVAYNPKNRELRVVECKSFLDSRGVRARSRVQQWHKEDAIQAVQ